MTVLFERGKRLPYIPKIDFLQVTYYIFWVSKKKLHLGQKANHRGGPGQPVQENISPNNRDTIPLTKLSSQMDCIIKHSRNIVETNTMRSTIQNVLHKRAGEPIIRIIHHPNRDETLLSSLRQRE